MNWILIIILHSSTSDFLNCLPPQDESDSFHFREIKQAEILKEVSKAGSQARGADKVPPLCQSLHRTCTAYFFSSLTQASFPAIWKMSMVVAINEVRSPAQPGDYRAISLLFYLSKVFENLVSQQVYSFIEKKSLLDDFRTGYRSNHST